MWERVARPAIGPRLMEGSATIAGHLETDVPALLERPSPARWSALEYGAHVRDVLLHVRDRVVVALVEDNPEFKPLYRDERVDLGLYAAQRPELVALELRGSTRLFVQTIDALDAEQLQRPCQYTYPAPATRTILWMAQQVVHEVEHHLADIEVNLAELTAPGGAPSP